MSAKSVCESLQELHNISISPTTLYGYENDYRAPNIGTVIALCKIYGADIVDVLEIDREYLDICASGKGITEELKKWVVEEALEEYPIELYMDAEENAENSVIKSYEKITDKELRNKYIEFFLYLNRLGRIEAVKRMEELTTIDKYHKTWKD